MASVATNGVHEDDNANLLDDYDVESGSEKDFLLEAARQAPVEVRHELAQQLHKISPPSTSSASSTSLDNSSQRQKAMPVWKRKKLEAPPPQPETFRARQELLRQFTDGHDVMAGGTAAPSIAQLQGFRQQVYLYGCAVGMGRHEAEIQVTWAVERFCRARQEKGLELINTRDTNVDLNKTSPSAGDDLETRLDALRDHALRDPIDVDTAWAEVKKVIDTKDKKMANKNKRKVEAEAEKGVISAPKQQDSRSIRGQPPQKKVKAELDVAVDNTEATPGTASTGSRRRRRRADRRRARHAERNEEQQESAAVTFDASAKSTDPVALPTESAPTENGRSSAPKAVKSEKKQTKKEKRQDVPIAEKPSTERAVADQVDGSAEDVSPRATITTNNEDDPLEFKDNRTRKTKKRGKKREKLAEGGGAALEPQDEDEARKNYLKSNAQEDVKDGPQEGESPHVQAEKDAQSEAFVDQIHDEIRFNQSKEIHEFGKGKPEGSKMQEKAAMKELETELQTEKAAQDRVDTAHGITPGMKDQAADVAREKNVKQAEADGTFSENTGKTLPQLRKEEREKAIFDENGAAKPLSDLVNENDHAAKHTNNQELASGDSGLGAADEDEVDVPADVKKLKHPRHECIHRSDSTQTGAGLSDEAAKHLAPIAAPTIAKNVNLIASGIATPELSAGAILDHDRSLPVADALNKNTQPTRKQPRKSTTSPYFTPPERPKKTARKKKLPLDNDTREEAKRFPALKPAKTPPEASRTSSSKQKKEVGQSRVASDQSGAQNDVELPSVELPAESESKKPDVSKVNVSKLGREAISKAGNDVRNEYSPLRLISNNAGSGDSAFEHLGMVAEDLGLKDEAIEVKEAEATTPKSAKGRRVTKSPFFPIKKRETKPKSPRKKGGTVSCIPFPRLDVPRFGLMQEILADDPYRLLIAVTFLIRTHGKHAIPVYFKLMEQYPTPESIVAADREDIIALTHHLGFQNQRCNIYKKYANAFVTDPPIKGRRYRTQNYPHLGSHKDIKKGEVLEDDDPRFSAFEIGHMTEGRYALDSWRMFCRDVLRGQAQGYDGEGREADFEPEWKRVLPQDKELRAWMRWRYLKDGLEWDPETGATSPANDIILAAAKEGRIAWDDAGGMRIVHVDEEPITVERRDSQPADDGDVSGLVAQGSM